MVGIILLLSALLAFNLLSNALSILIVSSLIVVITYRFPNFFKKGYYLYSLALIISILSVIFYKDIYVRYILGGIFGYGFFLVVMMVGVLPNKWTVSRNIKKVRGNLSIIGFILISPHALMHIFGIFGSIDLFGIAAYALMVPLTIVSFKFIKKEINPADWLKIQKGAYGIYLLLFVHLLVVSSWENKIIYAVIVTIYLNNKLLKEFKK